MQEQDAYILGTDKEELHRLGLQHQVWASEAQKAWKLAGFTSGHSILDLGSGPGFCSKELAYIVGDGGRVIAVDRSKAFIRFLKEMSNLHELNIEAIAADFKDLKLKINSLDGMYCRWALAWVKEPRDILNKVYGALKPGGRMVLHEYYDWSTHQTNPSMPSLSKAISACLRSFKEQEGDIDVGKDLTIMLEEIGMKIISTRPMMKMARPNELTWQWPRSFYNIYLPKLVSMGYLEQDTVDSALQDVLKLERDEGSTLCCPLLIEVIAEKV